MADRDEAVARDGVGPGVSDRDGWFDAWVVATFDLVALSLLVLVAAHASGFLAGALSGFGTLPGLLVFGYLWTLVVVGVRWVLSAGGLDTFASRRRRARLVRGVAGGAFVGSAFVLGTVLVGGGVAAVADPELVATVLFVAGVGTAVAAVVGAVVGLVSTGVNLLLFRVSGWVVPSGGDDAERA
ncbi:hypothetical protein SAMN04487947_1079 [Halogeometricum rufum]|uniref:DUF7965 domain-containing protein n=1 Tax=Halogeometricum rufum TaxID=553469 RepID=A0A1I6GFJ7_9EURY|nr:hypothetical protein [Halogeometricum rufum]SFR40993.1 hypothetical protein SAMN04487947_1079 [Halogeometricum rufum]